MRQVISGPTTAPSHLPHPHSPHRWRPAARAALFLKALTLWLLQLGLFRTINEIRQVLELDLNLSPWRELHVEVAGPVVQWLFRGLVVVEIGVEYTRPFRPFVL